MPYMVQKNKLEIACFNIASALIAQENGADRVELCDGIEVGGITPNAKIVAQVKSKLAIDVMVMIRPRGGNFIYSKEELEQMKYSIEEFKKLNVNGFVFGILKEDNSINKEQNSELVELAKPFPCTFHRAFDEVSAVFQSLEDIIDCGFKTILTSGQAKNATEGVATLAALVSKANNRIIIMPGGGLRASNVQFIKEKTNANWFHSSAITDDTETANPKEVVDIQSNLKSIS
jgi:copper homeostasis protein